MRPHCSEHRLCNWIGQSAVSDVTVCLSVCQPRSFQYSWILKWGICPLLFSQCDSVRTHRLRGGRGASYSEGSNTVAVVCFLTQNIVQQCCGLLAELVTVFQLRRQLRGSGGEGRASFVAKLWRRCGIGVDRCCNVTSWPRGQNNRHEDAPKPPQIHI